MNTTSSDSDTIRVESVRGFIKKQAQKYQTWLNEALDYDDLVSAGTIGAIIAARRFDESSGVPFLAYAKFWIRHEILDEIRDKNRTIRVPLQTRPTPDDEQINRALRRTKTGGVVSLDALLDKDVVFSIDEISPEDAAIAREMEEKIREALDCLNDRQRAAITWRFCEELSFAKVGSKLGVTRSRARQIAMAACNKLRQRLSVLVDPAICD